MRARLRPPKAAVGFLSALISASVTSQIVSGDKTERIVAQPDATAERCSGTRARPTFPSRRRSSASVTGPLVAPLPSANQ